MHARYIIITKRCNQLLQLFGYTACVHPHLASPYLFKEGIFSNLFIHHQRWSLNSPV